MPAGGLGDRDCVRELAHRFLHPVRQPLHRVGDALIGTPVRPAYGGARQQERQQDDRTEPIRIASDTPETRLTLLQY